jgi:hypothetical protein
MTKLKNNELKNCVYCGESIPAGASVCKYCRMKLPEGLASKSAIYRLVSMIRKKLKIFRGKHE